MQVSKYLPQGAERAMSVRLFVSQRLGAVPRPLLLMWVVCIAFGMATWLLWGSSGWPVGSYWWDELALSGGGHAIREGLVPSVDFWAPFILPLYLKLFAQHLGGVSGGYVAECLMQGGVTLLLLTLLLGRKKHAWPIYLMGGWSVALAFFPFNIGSVVEAELGSVVFAGGYNRFGSALMTLALLLPIVWRGREWRLSVWLAAVLVLAFFLKITVLQIILGLAFAHALLVGGRSGWRVLFQSVGLAVVVGFPCLMALDGGGGYFSAIHDMSTLRMGVFQDRIDVSRQFLSEHRLELFVAVLVALLLAVRGLLERRKWVGLVCWYLIAMGAVVVYALTNFGDNGLFPLSSVMFSAIWQARADGAQDIGAHLSVHGRVVRALTRTVLFLWGGMFACHALMMSTWFVAHELRARDADFIHFPVRSAYLANNYVLEKSAWDQRPPIATPGVPINPKKAASYAGYVAAVDDAVQYLNEKFPDRRKSVYVLDFPALVFSFAGGYRVPHGVYPWMLYGHELNIDHHPAGPMLLADVDVLLTSKCSMSSKNRRLLPGMYRSTIEQDWLLSGSLPCWDVYQRRNPRP